MKWLCNLELQARTPKRQSTSSAEAQTMFVMMFVLQAYMVTSNSVNILVCHVAWDNKNDWMIIEIENDQVSENSEMAPEARQSSLWCLLSILHIKCHESNPCFIEKIILLIILCYHRNLKIASVNSNPRSEGLAVPCLYWAVTALAIFYFSRCRWVKKMNETNTQKH